MLETLGESDIKRMAIDEPEGSPDFKPDVPGDLEDQILRELYLEYRNEVEWMSLMRYSKLLGIELTKPDLTRMRLIYDQYIFLNNTFSANSFKYFLMYRATLAAYNIKPDVEPSDHAIMSYLSELRNMGSDLALASTLLTLKELYPDKVFINSNDLKILEKMNVPFGTWMIRFEYYQKKLLPGKKIPITIEKWEELRNILEDNKPLLEVSEYAEYLYMLGQIKPDTGKGLRVDPVPTIPENRNF